MSRAPRSGGRRAPAARAAGVSGRQAETRHAGLRSHEHLAVGDHRGDELVAGTELSNAYMRPHHALQSRANVGAKRQAVKSVPCYLERVSFTPSRLLGLRPWSPARDNLRVSPDSRRRLSVGCCTESACRVRASCRVCSHAASRGFAHEHRSPGGCHFRRVLAVEPDHGLRSTRSPLLTQAQRAPVDGARGRSRTDTLLRAADFPATSAFAAPSGTPARVRGLEHAFTVAL